VINILVAANIERWTLLPATARELDKTVVHRHRMITGVRLKDDGPTGQTTGQ